MQSDIRPLKGYRVVDFGHYVAGPAAGMMLADFGADVVSVVPKGGSRWKHPASRILARNKTCVEVDLKDPEGLHCARTLVESADVLIENFRPGVMDRLGLSYESFGSNPGLVYLSLPGFASTDTERAHLRAFEAIISAASGQFTDMGLNRVLMGINPSFSPLTLASAYGAALGTNAILYALFNRGRTGRGDRIEVPLASALMEGLAYNSQRVERYPERYKSPREKEIERRQANGIALDMAYGELQEFLDPFYRSYKCSDGRLIYVVCASHTAHAKRALEVLGIWEDVKALGIPEHDDWYRPISEWADDCALGHYPLSAKWARIVSDRMAKAFSADTAFSWEQKLGDGRVPARAHRTTEEWLHTDHAVKAGLIVESQHPEFGALRSFGPFAWLRDPGLGRPEIVPGLKADVSDVVANWAGKRNNDCEGRGESRYWLGGVKILDMTNVIAGPTISSFLSRFGPEIIKLDPVKSTFDPWNTIVFGMQGGRGKQSILADVTTEDGRKVLTRLIEWADLITFNGSDRQVEHLGLDEASLKKINPKAILCQVDAFGGPLRGPMSDHPGYDDTVQAMTGVMIRFGGGRDTPEEHAHFGTIDVLGGYLAACAAGAALVMQMDQNKGSRARTSLAAAGQLIQAPFMYDYPGRAPFNEPSGRKVLGEWAGYRFYRARDAWIFVACAHRDEFSGLLQQLGLPDLLPEAEQERLFEKVIYTKNANEWVAILSRLDLGVVVPASIAELRERYLEDEGDSGSTPTGTYQFVRHPLPGANRWVDLFAPCAIRATTGAIKANPAAEKYGFSTRKILGDLNFDALEIESMVQRRIAADEWCEFYLPE
ncbi:CoA transferase [Mesorhizobium carmichaelinearum]|uniref:CoA transferase n=1 Tax=Mesorhizobium carmichaelinearum TaxID=1208188 RepID=UPI0018E0A0A6|nr:CoA transferase [Mesorhizobium carmichaelinearum]